MKKKILSLLVAVFTLITFVSSANTYAESIPSLKGLSREELIKQDEIAAEKGYDKLITSFTVNEYDAIMNLQKKSEATLKQQGLSPADIQEIKEFDADKIITELKNKSVEELEEIGYTEERIENIKAYDGRDASIQAVLSSNLYCDIYLRKHEYDSNDRTTTFRVRLDWEWDEPPMVSYTDIIGAVVSEGMYFDDGLSYHRINYYHYSLSDDYREIYDFYPADVIHAMESTFEVLDGNYYAMDGRAYCGFTKSGRVPEIAMVIHYGHSGWRVNPSVSAGGGSLSITFEPELYIDIMNQYDNYYIHSRDYGDRVTYR